MSLVLVSKIWWSNRHLLASYPHELLHVLVAFRHVWPVVDPVTNNLVVGLISR